MEKKIGEAAGIAWRYLRERGKTPITRLVSDICFEARIEKNIVYMVIGWLAREDKLNFSFDSVGNRCDIWLK